jgi:selenocysteine-specific elongation factor
MTPSRFVVIGTAGHIDHGKSALVQALSGIDPDRLKEEKARGITIDLGFAHFEADGATVALVDVPGHERFVKNMLAGASGIDAVLLVVAADESVMPQTREHFDICRLLGVTRGIVVLTKADLVDAETLELVRLEVRELVAGSPLAGAPIVAVSSKTGAGLMELRAEIGELARGAARETGAPGGGPSAARLPVDRVFTVKGFGTVVTGTLVSGAIRENDELALLPSGRAVKVRGLQVHGHGREAAVAGQRAAVNLGGVDLADVARGDTLATPGALEPTRRFDAVLQLLPSARPLKHGARVRVHQGTSEVLGRVAIASRRRSGEAPGAAPSALEPGAEAYVRVRLEGPAVLGRGDRYVVRSYSPPVTIGGGVVLDPQPPRSATRTAAGRRRFERLDPAPPGAGGPVSGLEAAAAMVEERGAAGLPRAALVSRAGVAPGALDRTVAELEAHGLAVPAGDVLASPRVLTHLGERLLADLATHHRAEPLSEGVPREELRERLFGRASPAVFARVLADLAAAGRVVARDRVALAGHQVSLSPAEAAARDAIEAALEAGGLTPPDLQALQAGAGAPAEVADRMLAWLVRQKRAVRLGTLVFHAGALAGLKADMAALKQAAAGASEPVRLDVAAFKARYGMTRKFAIPLLEYLDRERVTRRMGEVRIVL